MVDSFKQFGPFPVDQNFSIIEDANPCMFPLSQENDDLADSLITDLTFEEVMKVFWRLKRVNISFDAQCEEWSLRDPDPHTQFDAVRNAESYSVSLVTTATPKERITDGGRFDSFAWGDRPGKLTLGEGNISGDGLGFNDFHLWFYKDDTVSIDRWAIAIRMGMTMSLESVITPGSAGGTTLNISIFDTDEDDKPYTSDESQNYSILGSTLTAYLKGRNFNFFFGEDEPLYRDDLLDTDQTNDPPEPQPHQKAEMESGFGTDLIARWNWDIRFTNFSMDFEYYADSDFT